MAYSGRFGNQRRLPSTRARWVDIGMSRDSNRPAFAFSFLGRRWRTLPTSARRRARPRIEPGLPGNEGGSACSLQDEPLGRHAAGSPFGSRMRVWEGAGARAALQVMADKPLLLAIRSRVVGSPLRAPRVCGLRSGSARGGHARPERRWAQAGARIRGCRGETTAAVRLA